MWTGGENGLHATSRGLAQWVSTSCRYLRRLVNKRASRMTRTCLRGGRSEHSLPALRCEERRFEQSSAGFRVAWITHLVNSLSHLHSPRGLAQSPNRAFVTDSSRSHSTIRKIDPGLRTTLISPQSPIFSHTATTITNLQDGDGSTANLADQQGERPE